MRLARPWRLGPVPLGAAPSARSPSPPGVAPSPRGSPGCGPARFAGHGGSALPALACPAPARRGRGVLARRGLELGPACLWRAALSSASARPHTVGLGMAPLSPAARNTTRVQLGPSVCATRSRRVSAACVCVLAWCAQCFGTARRALDALVYPLDVPVYPPCVFHA